MHRVFFGTFIWVEKFRRVEACRRVDEMQRPIATLRRQVMRILRRVLYRRLVQSVVACVIENIVGMGRRPILILRRVRLRIN